MGFLQRGRALASCGVGGGSESVGGRREEVRAVDEEKREG